MSRVGTVQCLKLLVMTTKKDKLITYLEPRILGFEFGSNVQLELAKNGKKDDLFRDCVVGTLLSDGRRLPVEKWGALWTSSIGCSRIQSTSVLFIDHRRRRRVHCPDLDGGLRERMKWRSGSSMNNDELHLLAIPAFFDVSIFSAFFFCLILGVSRNQQHPVLPTFFMGTFSMEIFASCSKIIS